MWFFVGRKGGYGQPTVLDLKKGESRGQSGSNSIGSPSNQASGSKPGVTQPAHQTTVPQPAAKPMQTTPPIIQADHFPKDRESKMRDVTPQRHKLQTPPPPPGPPVQCFFIYNGHDWDAYEVLGISPYSSFSEITKVYQQQIKKADPGKHEFLQTAYMAILKKF